MSGVTDRQAAEARDEPERIREALDLGLQAWRPTPVREKFLAALNAVDALSARLAQAEQERDGAILESDERGAKWNAAEARLREYEEALRKIANGLELPGGRHDLYAAHASQEIARAALAGDTDG